MPTRKIHVDMDDLLSAIDSHGDEAIPHFHTKTGAVEYWTDLDEIGDDAPFDPEDPDWQAVPRRESHRAFRAMEQFIDGIDEPDVQEKLRITLGGRGAFRRFRDVLARYPDLRTQWEVAEHTALLDLALAWLAALEIEPTYELRRPATTAAPTPRQPGAAAITLADMLLLGAPEGKNELLDGRVYRVHVAVSAAKARQAFVNLARELTEQAGLGWRKRLVENLHRYEVDRYHLSVADKLVELEVDMPRAVWDEFSRH
ncbi:MAG: UPF0158 family protein [Planctomycetota bacterium]